jgi:protein-tyrosine phosphatase
MIDLHCHILPGLDDGSINMEESMKMAQAAVDEGIHTIIATPHHANGRYKNEAMMVMQAVMQLNAELNARDIPLEVGCGQEIRLYARLVDDLYEHRLLTLHQSNYLLLELPPDQIPQRIFELLHELQVLNIKAVIAHPERNQEIVQNPDKLVRLIEAGALSQITAHSISGVSGSKIEAVSLELCRLNLVHFVASDAHNLHLRPFGLRNAYECIDSKLGTEYVDYYRNNAQIVLDNEIVIAWEPQRRKKKWFVI